MRIIKKYVIWSVLLSALVGLSGCGNSSSDTTTASDFSMTLDVDESTVTADWETLSSASGSDTLSASVVTQGTYGNFAVTGDSLTYLKTTETNETDTGVLQISDGADSVQIKVTVHSLYWKQISEGDGHTSAIKSDGTLWSWGDNTYGQLGDGTTDNSTVPVQESTKSIDWVITSSGGGHTAAIRSDGTLWSWGLNSEGQLGDGTTVNSSVPVQEDTAAIDWSSVRAGTGYTVAVKTTGKLWRWGRRNTAPVANAQSVTTVENTPILITLSGSDVNNDPLTYLIVTGPSNGTLSAISVNQVTYTPNAGYTGADSFTFKVNDGTVDSAPATVSITINPDVDVNTPPVANAQNVSTDENVAKAITLSGSDADNDPLTYAVVTDPSNGTLTGTAPNLTYTPNTDYSGADSFTFKVNDGTVDSAPATVSITVNAVVNPSDTVLAQIGLEADSPDTVNSVVTVAQLNVILPALTDVNATYETAYQDYIDANPDAFANPATQVEVQAMIDAVNAAQGATTASDTVLAQIGLEADSPDVVNSVVTVAQLNVILPALTDVNATYETVYQDYIDANPDLFSEPATQAEVQAMIDAVNAAQGAAAASDTVLAQIGLEADSPDIVNSVVTVPQLNVILPALTNVNAAYEAAYQDYIDANPDLFSSPATQAEVQAMIDAVNASLTGHITIDNATLQKVIGSTFDNTPYSPAIDIQGVIDAGGVAVTVPYTVVNAPVTLPAYSTSVTLDASVTEDSEVGIIATFAWTEQTNLPVGSGTFTATITIDDGGAGIPDNTYNAKKLDIQDDSAGLVAALFPYATDDVGGTGTLTLKIYPGIPDRMYGVADNNGDTTSHEFLYLPVTNTTTGKTWLNNNLGANYANTNSPVFDPTQQATASNDHNAYGSLFQWGRKADGHELITWTDGSTGTGVNGTTSTNSDDPADALFITEPPVPAFPLDWRVTQDDTLWASESSSNNVCPTGYRVPTGGTGGELDLERLSWGSDNAAGAIGGALKLPMPGYRYYYDGTVINAGTDGYYWGSTVFNEGAQYLLFYGSTANMGLHYRATGITVRCIQVDLAAEVSDAVLAQIGAEADTGDTTNSVVTIAQLSAILPSLTGIVPANETAYQDYIDANPDLFSSPATQAEVQAMIDAVNAIPVPLPGNITIDSAALQKVIGSTFDNTPYSPAIDIQGVIDAGGVTVTVPYTVVNAPVTLPAYSTSVTLDASVTEDDEAGIVATFAWEEQNLSVGSGTFTATITIDDSGAGIPDDTYNAKKLDIEDDSAGLVATTFPYATDNVGGTGTLTLKIYPGIPDRMFGQADNTGDATTHMFLYLPVTNTTTGETWLNNNLGANYANTNNLVFNHTQQATASNDHNAYGSLFQWGRKADGHELITWTDGSMGTGVNGTTSTNSNVPTDALFITELDYPNDWRVTQDNTLWASESSSNNVCPTGYRVPTGGELNLERLSWGSNDAAGAIGGALKLPMPGYRLSNNGSITSEGTNGVYWGSTVISIYAQILEFYGYYASDAYINNGFRVYGRTVRCIKD